MSQMMKTNPSQKKSRSLYLVKRKSVILKLKLNLTEPSRRWYLKV